LANSCAEGLGGSLLSSEAGGEVSGRACLGPGVGDFVGKENTFKKSIAEAVERVFDAVDFDKIHAEAEDSFGVHFFAMA
jgi:hypothetical protein